ncbi:olfactory receptor 4B13-like [Rhinoderma darwinii]|uniref:olfactory receptor 4B13-like n=1 Tax=Rhinoderma darwinii TaxID=43563 RepID=UPI003F67681B
MENVSRISPNLVLIGLVEMENLKYLFSVAALVLYITTMMLCSAIIYVIRMEEKLHEPMYIFIGNLVFNAIIGGSTIMPKLVTDLLLGLHTIDLPGCLIQAFCIKSFAYAEIFTFTIMAYDRYVAIGRPLMYSTLMTNEKALKSIAITWVIVFANRIVGVTLAARLTLCGEVINNVYCETMSLTRLACGGTTIITVFGTTSTLIVISVSANQKAIHTLVTHIAAFSTFMVATLFVGFRVWAKVQKKNYTDTRNKAIKPDPTVNGLFATQKIVKKDHSPACYSSPPPSPTLSTWCLLLLHQLYQLCVFSSNFTNSTNLVSSPPPFLTLPTWCLPLHLS